MQNDGNVRIAVGRSADTKVWKNVSMDWSKLVEKITTEYRTYETLAEYKAMTKDEQSRIKDVGGFVGGYLTDGKRTNACVQYRYVLCLDLDDARPDAYERFKELYPVASACYSTHKHTPEKPRLRIVAPLSRRCRPDEYEAVGRWVADKVGMEMFDPTTFQPARLMFWPSTPKDGVFYSDSLDAPWLDVDAVLLQYMDWSDVSEWPRGVRENQKEKRAHAKQEDPTTKKGCVGAFCRIYSVSRAIDEFLSDVYEEGDKGAGRYTYKGGSTSNGVVLYDDLFAYSNHATDPAGGQLCNAFDLVRIHRFGELDTKGEDGLRAPSYVRMVEWASTELEEVKAELIQSRLNEARMEFAEESEQGEQTDDTSWMNELKTDKGMILAIAPNFTHIFRNDPKLKGRFRYNEFTCREYVTATVPWRRVTTWETISDADMAGLRSYFESVYGMYAPQKLDDAFTLELRANSYHPVKDYLNSLVWDGVPRLDTSLVDYLGADDNIYTREVIRKTLVGAVARVSRAGLKFDQVLTLVGPQGCGKSTFVSKLGGDWFSDTLPTVQGKEAYESIQGVWIMEMGELAALKKAEVEPIKQFISKVEDRFRPAYGRKVETFKRQTIFIGTTNNLRFLKDNSGNRRFFPVDVKRGRLNVFGDNSDLDKNRDQIWAEAYYLYKNGEALILSEEAERMAEGEREDHQELDERKGVLESFLETRLPDDWSKYGLLERRRYFEDKEVQESEGSVARDKVCAVEIWCEFFGKDVEEMNKYSSREVADLMESVSGWEYARGSSTFPHYGKQRYYARTDDNQPL